MKELVDLDLLPKRKVLLKPDYLNFFGKRFTVNSERLLE